MVTIGGLVRRERLRRQERQVDAAARFGVSQSTYSRWESGAIQPDDRHFAAIGRYVGIGVEDLWEAAHGEGGSAAAAAAAHDALLAQIDALRSEIEDLRRQLAEVGVDVPAATSPAVPVSHT